MADVLNIVNMYAAYSPAMDVEFAELDSNLSLYYPTAELPEQAPESQLSYTDDELEDLEWGGLLPVSDWDFEIASYPSTSSGSFGYLDGIVSTSEDLKYINVKLQAWKQGIAGLTDDDFQPVDWSCSELCFRTVHSDGSLSTICSSEEIISSSADLQYVDAQLKAWKQYTGQASNQILEDFDLQCLGSCCTERDEFEESQLGYCVPLTKRNLEKLEFQCPAFHQSTEDMLEYINGEDQISVFQLDGGDDDSGWNTTPFSTEDGSEDFYSCFSVVPGDEAAPNDSSIPSEPSATSISETYHTDIGIDEKDSCFICDYYDSLSSIVTKLENLGIVGEPEKSLLHKLLAEIIELLTIEEQASLRLDEFRAEDLRGTLSRLTSRFMQVVEEVVKQEEERREPLFGEDDVECMTESNQYRSIQSGGRLSGDRVECRLVKNGKVYEWAINI